MFTGISALNLDGKGRMTVPTRHRDALSVRAEGRLVITRNPNGCLMLYPGPAWVKFEDQLADQPMETEIWRTMYLGYAQDVEMDGTGRILIPPELRVVAKLDREVKLMGVGDHFEIWNQEVLDAKLEMALQAGMPESLRKMSISR